MDQELLFLGEKSTYVLHKVPTPTGITVNIQKKEFLEKEQFSAVIDEGGHAYIYFALDKDGNPCTLKVLKDNSRLKYLRLEKNILQNIQAKGVIKYIDTVHLESAFVDKDSQPIILILEYFEAPSLFRIVNTSSGNLIPEDEILSLGIKVCQVLASIHSINVYHLNLSPKSILYDRLSGEIRIIHFGNHEEKESEFDYVLHEQNESRGVCDHRSDIYSLGCVLHFCCYGTPKMLQDKYYEGKKLSKQFFEKVMNIFQEQNIISAENLSHYLDSLLHGTVPIQPVVLGTTPSTITTTPTTTSTTTTSPTTPSSEAGEKKEDCVLL